MVMAARVPAAMLFLRSPGGISHHPDEAVREEDVEAALHVGRQFLGAWPSNPGLEVPARTRKSPGDLGRLSRIRVESSQRTERIPFREVRVHQLGSTRSSLKTDHLLQTPDTFVRTPLPGAEGVDSSSTLPTTRRELHPNDRRVLRRRHPRTGSRAAFHLRSRRRTALVAGRTNSIS